MNFKNLFCQFVCLIAMTLFLYSCSGDKSSPAPAPAPAPKATATPAPAPVPETATEPAPAPEPEASAADTAEKPKRKERKGKVITIAPGPDAQTEIQEALIEAKPGMTIQLEEGRFDLVIGLSLDVNKVTLRGMGMDKTILDFTNQEVGSEGLYVTGDFVTLEDFAIENTKGNGQKSQAADNIVIRRVRAEWTGGPKATNGAYGLYPVSSKNVLIEECVAIGASDAGIYVGQSIGVVVRNSRAEFNVAGIEIENCHSADVYGCVATNNTGGILVFDLPDLPQQKGHDVRLFNNEVYNNNTPNFAPAGNIVASVPTGSGVMIMANTNVEIFENTIKDHLTTNALVVSYYSTFLKIKDPNYYPYAEKIHIHHNTFGDCGSDPAGNGALIAVLMEVPLPDIIWDGVFNEEKAVDGRLNPEDGLSIHDNTKENGEVRFAELGGATRLPDPTQAVIDTDISRYAAPLPSLPPVSIPGVE